MPAYSLTKKQTLLEFQSSSQGLSSQEATRRLGVYGKNELVSTRRWQWLRRLIEPFSSLFVMILLVGAGLSFLTGHRGDGIIILMVVVINAVIEWSQQFSAARVLASLKSYGAKQVTVRRGGRVSKVVAVELVPGDIVLLAEGEKIPADGRLLETFDLRIDESSLTGESKTILKSTATLGKSTPIYEQTNMVFNGTLVHSGRGVFCVTSTGNATEFGKIAKMADLAQKKPPISDKIDQLTRRLIIVTLLAAVAVLSLGWWRGADFWEMLRFVIALTVSVIPEGLPVTLTIIFLLGVQRMARKKALVRQLAAVETLGMVTAIATDKTGTLTSNQAAVSEAWHPKAVDRRDLWLSISHHHPELNNTIDALVADYVDDLKPAGWRELADLPFEAKRRLTALLWQKDQDYWVYIKGAPETILATTKLAAKDGALIQRQVEAMAENGQRVIAVARKKIPRPPDQLAEYTFKGMEFVAVVGFADQLRPEATAAIATTRSAGIKVYLLTGDHLATGRSIAQRVGIIGPSEETAEGAALAAATPSQLERLLKRVRVFARVLPEHKFKLLQALKQSEITAMTGDGVNDAPALAQADVGIAMGSGTDVAKEAADIVLLDDNYATIVAAIAEGRTIYANIRKMVYYLLSTNSAEALTIIVALIIGLPLPLTAAQVLWLNLVTDTTTVIPLGLEAPEKKLMHQPPRQAQESLLSNHLISRLILVAITMTACTLAIYWLFLPQGFATASTMAFLTLAVTQWANAFNARSENQLIVSRTQAVNYKLWLGIGLSLLLLWPVIYGPLQPFMGTAAVSVAYLSLLALPFLMILIVSDAHKQWVRQRRGGTA